MNTLDSSQSSAGGRPLRVSGRWLLLGICGSGMRAFAEMLLDAGESVIGSDLDDSALSDLKASRGDSLKLFPWTHPINWNDCGPLTVVHTLAVSAHSPLASQALERGVPVFTLPQALAAFLANTKQICVAGTHGKTTTSGMIWWMLNEAGLSPAGYVGGEFCGTQRTGTFGKGLTAVVESCEYRHSFLSLNPQTAVVTGIEADHFDCFRNDADTDTAFRRFMEKTAGDGVLIVNAGSARAIEAAKSVSCRVIRYGLSVPSGWSAGLRATQSQTRVLPKGFGEWRQSFELLFCGTRIAEVSLRIPGLHNVENAMAALLAVHADGLTLSQAVHHLSTFPGMRRRFEHRGTWRGADLIDDYAHHPTAISATLQTARTVFAGRRIIAIFEPHQVSRTEHLFSDFTRVLSTANECLVLPVFPARETASPASCSRLSGQIVRRISEAGGRAFFTANLDQVLARLDHATQIGDVVITMGAGRTHQIHDEIHRRLQRNSAA